MKIFVALILYSIIYIFANNNVQITGHNYYDNRQKSKKIEPKIYDIVHKFLPDLYIYEDLHNIITLIFIIPLFFNIKIFKEFLGYIIVIFCIRSITTNITILPKYKKCKEQSMFGGCYDKIFSGHFTVVFLATLLYFKYKWINLNILILINFINSLSILLVRGHYTIDLIIAFFITLCIYQNKLFIK